MEGSGEASHLGLIFFYIIWPEKNLTTVLVCAGEIKTLRSIFSESQGWRHVIFPGGAGSLELPPLRGGKAFLIGFNALCFWILSLKKKIVILIYYNKKEI